MHDQFQIAPAGKNTTHANHDVPMNHNVCDEQWQHSPSMCGVFEIYGRTARSGGLSDMLNYDDQRQLSCKGGTSLDFKKNTWSLRERT